jgi:Ca2+-transporting ATPase
MAVGGSVLMQFFVVQVPFLQYIFETEPLGFLDFVKIIAVSSIVFLLDEFWKYAKL